MTAHWPVPTGLHTVSVRLPVEGELPSFGGATGWLNSAPLTVDGLRGSVVLVNFWTFTCINWLRQLPYVRAWAEKYQDHGLIVVGVHTPEFDVEHDLDNVSRAVRELRVSYPVAIGNDYAVWSAFDNHYWPALYSADAGHELVSVDARGAEAPADWDSLRSPENYTGYARTENLASPGGAILGQRHACTAPPQLRRNHWALSGDWTMEQQATTLNAASGRSSTASMPATCTWSWDPRPRRRPYGSASFSTDSPGRHHGTDVDDQGDGTVTEPRLHQLIRQPGPVSDRTFEITFLDPGVQAYCFTFG